MSDNCFQIIKFLAVEYHNYGSHTYRYTQLFFVFVFFFNIKRSFQGLSYYFSHWHCGYIKFLQNAYEMCLYSQLSTSIVQFSLVISRVRFFATPWIAACPASLSITNSLGLPKPVPIESVMPSSHLILCRPLLLLPNPPQHRGLSNESTLCIRWPKYWSFRFNISPSNEYPRLISFRMDWLDLFAVQGTLKSLLQHHRSWMCLHPQKFRNGMKLCWMHAQKRKAHFPWNIQNVSHNTHIKTWYYSAAKKNEVMSFATRMNLEVVILSEVRHRKRNIVWYHLHAEFKKRKEKMCGTHCYN